MYKDNERSPEYFVHFAKNPSDCENMGACGCCCEEVLINCVSTTSVRRELLLIRLVSFANLYFLSRTESTKEA